MGGRRLSLLGGVLLALGLLCVPGAGAATGPIVDGAARFEVISPSLIRVEYAAGGAFEDRPTLTVPNRAGLGGAKFKTQVTEGVRVIKTSVMTVRYTLDSGPFGNGNLTVDLKPGGKGAPAFAPPHGAYQTASPSPGNLGGWYRALDGQGEPVPLHDGILSRNGWYLLDDTVSPLVRDGGFGFDVRPPRPGAYQDGYLFGYGDDYARALQDFRDLTGAAPLLPRRAFGIWFSRYQGYSETDYKQLLGQFRAHRVPLDVLVVDTDYKSPHDWNGWQWTPNYFPQPERFVKWAHDQKLELMLNVHPSIATDDPSYPAANAAAAGGLPDASGRCKRFVRDPLVVCGAWDWAKPSHVSSYFALHEPFEAVGIDAWWLDWCCDESKVDAPGVTPDTWINSLYAARAQALGKRWSVLSRIGGSYAEPGAPMVGVWAEHRSAIHFTGDTFDSWPMLDFQAMMSPAEGAGIGMPYVSHDVGSFLGGQLPRKLYVRWVQLGAFQPIFRFHSDHAPRLPWEYNGKAKQVAAEFLRLRESLVPYTYTLARKAYDSGLPLVRPMYLSWPNAARAYRFDHQYMFGGGLLVAPVGNAKGRKRVWFPPGEWTDIFTGRTYRGPASKTLKVPLDRMPVFARPGAIVPRQRYADRIGSGRVDPLLVDVYAGAKGTFSLYEDSGDGLAYRKGEGARTELRWSEGRRSATLAIGVRRGSYPGAPKARRYVVTIHGVARPRRVTLSAGGGRRELRNWRFRDGELTINVGRLATGRGASVELQFGRRR